MKKKFSIWLNIVTICLCMCAIMVGVYAATSATLTVSGQIGFKAHGCTGTVTGTIVGHAAGVGVAAKDGEPTTTPVPLNNGTAVNIGDANGLPLGSRYFSDINDSSDGKPTDIVITLKINNTSAYPIVASLGAVTKPSNVKVTGSDPIKLATGAQNIEFTITLSLEKTGESYTNITMPDDETKNLIITMDFSKYIAPEFEVKNGQLVTTMGHGTDADYTYANSPHEEEIEWFAFAVLGEGVTYTKPSFVTSSTVVTVGEQKWYSLTGATMTLDNAKNHTFWFIQRYVTAGGYYGDPNDTEFYYSWITAQQFNASYTDGNDYDQSDIHEYLSGYAYQAATGITSGMLYDITKREVNETYTTNYNSTAGTQENVFSSRLWLLSEAELALLGSQRSEPVKAYGIGNTAGDARGRGAGWWLRSPYPDDAYYAHFVDDIGYLDFNGVHSNYGVRAAFEIEIA